MITGFSMTYKGCRCVGFIFTIITPQKTPETGTICGRYGPKIKPCTKGSVSGLQHLLLQLHEFGLLQQRVSDVNPDLFCCGLGQVCFFTTRTDILLLQLVCSRNLNRRGGFQALRESGTKTAGDDRVVGPEALYLSFDDDQLMKVSLLMILNLISFRY